MLCTKYVWWEHTVTSSTANKSKYRSDFLNLVLPNLQSPIFTLAALALGPFCLSTLTQKLTFGLNVEGIVSIKSRSTSRITTSSSRCAEASVHAPRDEKWNLKVFICKYVDIWLEKQQCQVTCQRLPSAECFKLVHWQQHLCLCAEYDSTASIICWKNTTGKEENRFCCITPCISRRFPLCLPIKEELFCFLQIENIKKILTFCIRTQDTLF